MHSPGTTLPAALKSRGVSRREFVQFCSSMVATLALPPRYLGIVMKALTQASRPVLVWLEFQDCAGNSESMLRSSNPPVQEFVLDLLSWEYHELLMAGAGKQAEDALERVVREHAGEYIAVQPNSVTTRLRAIGSANWSLVAQDPGRTKLTSGYARAVDALNVFDTQYFASDLEYEAVTRRLAEAVADQITLQLAVYFRKRATASG